MKKYLFVCMQNRIRSVRAADYFTDLLEEKGIKAEVENAGACKDSVKPIREEMVDSADVIFVMDNKVIYWLEEDNEWFKRKYQEIEKKIVILGIPDAFDPLQGEFQPWMLNMTEENKEKYTKKYGGKKLYQVLEEKKPLFEKYI